MSAFDELMGVAHELILQTSGEEVEIVEAGEVAPRTITARVTRNPVDPIGNMLVNSVQVYVSKADVPTLRVGLDRFRILADRKSPIHPPPEYVVERVVDETANDLDLLCTA